MPVRPRASAGFTLLELIIALTLAAAISVALVVAFRLGIRYVDRGQAFYASLQDMLAVTRLLRVELEPGKISDFSGDALSVTFVSRHGVEAGGFADRPAEIVLRCVEEDTGAESPTYRLEQSWQSPRPSRGDAEKAAASTGGQAPGELEGPKKEEDVEAEPAVIEPEQLEVLMRGLRQCDFSYLTVEEPEPAKNGGQTPSPAAAMAPPAPQPVESLAPTGKAEPIELKQAIWLDEWKKPGMPRALGLRLGDGSLEQPPVVFPLVRQE
ncbi:PulJ/GspJ family protein [Chitinimonas lacunae]|uniref:Type II secretion system protein J n=1 Tax=Chitinimonas lacunae TaxID=1963018 RepID=A0ABV8MUC6_9NEIS